MGWFVAKLWLGWFIYCLVLSALDLLLVRPAVREQPWWFGFPLVVGVALPALSLLGWWLVRSAAKASTGRLL